MIDTDMTANDRTEFYRDAESAYRLGRPIAAKRFLVSLCTRRAWMEAYAERTPLAFQADRASAIKRELLRECEARGYFAVGLTHIQITSIRRTS